jgi:hypothetical protein
MYCDIIIITIDCDNQEFERLCRCVTVILTFGRSLKFPTSVAVYFRNMNVPFMIFVDLVQFVIFC